MIYQHNQRKERDFKEEYKNAPQELNQANLDYQEAKKMKVKKFFRYIMIFFLIFLIYVFFRMGGIQLPQKVDIQEGYEISLNQMPIDFSLKKYYQKTYIPFVLSRVGDFTYYYSSDVDNKFLFEKDFPFEMKRYECYQDDKKVSCYDNLDDYGTIPNMYSKEALSTEEFTMSIYRGNCGMKDLRVYSGKIIRNLSPYLKKTGAYCIRLDLQEGKEETLRLELRFKMVEED